MKISMPLLLLLISFCAFASERPAVELRHGGHGHSDPADDESDDLELEISGPIQSIDLQTRTIAVLGVSIVVAPVNNDNSHRKGGNAVDILPTLIVGDFVKAEFESAAAPLTTRELSTVAAYAQALKIQGPLTAIDLNAKTVTVLGLTTGVSSSALAGTEDRGTDVATVALDRLRVGQNVEMQLDATTLPALVATSLRVQNFLNQVDLEFHNKSGKIESFDSDVEIRVSEIVKVRNAAGKFQKTEFKLHESTRSGTVSFAGLVPGTAKVEIVRGGVTTKKAIKIESNVKRTQKIKLKG